jgi:hypothetical protein
METNKSMMSRLLSTMDEEEIDDQSSIFAIGLVNYYKNIDKIQLNLSARKKLIELLHVSKRQMDKLAVMERLKYVEPITKEQFTIYVLFYYYYWLDQLMLLITGEASPFAHKYPEIKPEALEEEIREKAKQHITS